MVRRDRGRLTHGEMPSATRLSTKLANTRVISERTGGARSRSPLAAGGGPTAGRQRVETAFSHAGMPRLINSATPYPWRANATALAASCRTTSYCRHT